MNKYNTQNLLDDKMLIETILLLFWRNGIDVEGSAQL